MGEKKKFGKPFKARAPQAYDIIKLIASVQKPHTKKLSGQDIIKELSEIKKISGASGPLTVSITRNIENECVWKIFENGKLRTFEEAEVKAHE